MVKLPRKVNFSAIRKQWKISYIHTAGKLTLIELPHRKLIVRGHYSKRAAIQILTRWVKIKSKEYLALLIKKQNRKIKVTFKKLRIHSLKLEWGSYNTKKIISLHYKLIFLPPSLAQYIIIHELCHIRYLAHSPLFWKEVAKYDKNWKRHRTAMDNADSLIPTWLN